MKPLFTFSLLLFIASFLNAQKNHWQKTEDVLQSRSAQLPLNKVNFYRLDLSSVKLSLQNAPLFDFDKKNTAPQLTLPLSNGNLEAFEVFESPVMATGLAQKFPFIKTYIAFSKSGKTARLGFGKNEFHAMISNENGSYDYIELDKNTKDVYLCYTSKEVIMDEALRTTLQCGVNEKVPLLEHPLESRGDKVTLRTYRLALACTGEYAAKFGGTAETVMTNFATVVNRLNLIYGKEAAIQFQLITQNDKLINLISDDGYENGNLGSMLEQNSFQIGSKIATSDYDIGHVVGTKNTGGVIGLAQLAVACDQQRKALGASCILPSYSLDFFIITVIAHEMGHQFGAPHTFSDCGGSGTSGLNSVEPGCGTSIMSYGFDANDYFNIASLGYIWNFSRSGGGNTCPTALASNNSTPDVNLAKQSGFYIPINTPFELEGSATDTDNNNLTYCWEQVTVNQSLDPALFRSPTPSNNPTRIIPELPYVLRGQLVGNEEVLPVVSRDLGFRLTVRDNALPSAGVSWKELVFKATDTAGPFRVSSHNDANLSYIGGQLMEIKWDINNTNLAPVNCQTVDVLLSTDNGQTFSTILANKTTNDGIEYIAIPNIDAGACRVKVKASENIFFDINDRSFSIKQSITPSFSLGINNASTSSQACLPTQLSFDVKSIKINDYNKKIYLSLDKSKLPNGAIATFSKDSIAAGENATLNLDLTKVLESGTFTLDVLGKSKDKVDSTKLPISIKTLSNDFSDLKLLSPQDGLSNIAVLPATTFSWAESKNAQNYTFQLATSPAFAPNTMVFNRSNVLGSSITPNIVLSENTIYYWRLVPNNTCGVGKSTVIQVFQTIANACNSYKNEIALNIPSNAATSVESSITVNEDGEINDVNVGPLIGFHDFFKDVEMSLISPKGTTVKLFSGICGNFSGDFEFSLDDQAAKALECPPTRNIIGKPTEPLAAFAKENSKGIWKLKITDSAAGSGGRLTSWGLKLCSKLSVVPLNKVKNDTIFCEKGQSTAIPQNQLNFDDGLNQPNNLIYTILTMPSFGNILKDGTALGIGSMFSQADINGGKISYKHNGSNDKFDNFTFVLSNGKGAWLSNGKTNLKLLNTAIEEIGDEKMLSLYPNPAHQTLNVTINSSIVTDNFTLSLFNTQGQLIYNQSINSNQIQIDVKNLAQGVYFLKIYTDKIAFIKRFIKS